MDLNQNFSNQTESESEIEVAQSCPTLCNPVDCSLPGSSLHGILQARILQWLPFPAPGDLPDPGIEPRTPSLRADSLTSEPPGKPNQTEVFFLSFFFLMWTIFNIFIEFVTILLLCYLFVRLLVLDFWPWGMWNLISLNKDQTHTPSIGTWSLNPWTDRGISVWGVLIILNHQRNGTRILTIYSLGACHHRQIYPFSS